MSISIDKDKTKIKELICKKYITIDSNGKINFKSYLNIAIEKGDISEDDALLICLELMYGIKNYGFNHENIPRELKDLISKVSVHNSSDNPNLKNNIIFFKDYSFESEILNEYIVEFSSNVRTYSTSESKKNAFIDIKNYLNNFSREDLCYILDINPDLTFDKDKILKKRIADEFSKYDFDSNILIDSTSDEIKKYLDELKEHSTQNQPNELTLEIRNRMKEKEINRKKQAKIRINKNKFIQHNENQLYIDVNKEEPKVIKTEIIENKTLNMEQHMGVKENNFQSNGAEKRNIKNSEKKELDEILQKIRLFNNKKLQSMISLKEEYSHIYQLISSTTFNIKNNDVKRFKYYYENFDKIKNAISIISNIKQKEDLLDKFYFKLKNSVNLSDSKRKNILVEFKELYIFVYIIKDYPYCLKDKIIDEFENLDYFIQNFGNLLDFYDFKTEDYIKKIRLFELLEKIKIFNDKNVQEQVLLKKEYSEIYQEISKLDISYFNEHFSDICLFEDNFECCELVLDLINKIKQKEELLDEFCIEFNNVGYFSNSEREKLINKYKELYDLASLMYNFPEWTDLYLFNEFKNLEMFMTYYKGLISYNDKYYKFIIKEKNDKYIENKINENKSFFDDIKDDGKKSAIVTEEDNVKVVAGAGAGKTFIIEKKINYLIEKRHFDSEKILCLCFTKKNVDQLRRSVNKKSNDYKVKVFTFHEFCRRVDKECGGDKTSNRYLLDKIIRKYVEDIVKNPNKLSKLTEYFSYYSMPQLEERKFNSLEEYEIYREGTKLVSLKKKFYKCEEDIETAKGENVKSIGELLIANYLFMHEIEYEYERPYPFTNYSEMIKNRFLYSASYLSLNQISNCSNEELINKFIDWDDGWSSYRPDFYLPEDNIYLEHFGLDKNMEASFLSGKDKKKYEMSRYSKELYHKAFGTNLIETYFYYLPEGRLLKELEILLDKNKVTIGQMDEKKITEALINNERVRDFENFSKLVKNFINIYESKNLQKADFNLFKSKNTTNNIYNKNRQNLFLDISEEIYNEYYEENRKGDLSHNHEIFNALNLIKTKQFNKKYDYIFVDEYQDINQVRCQLLQELQKNSNAKLFVVGDDWQSIYGFSGSEVSLFVDFDKYFKNPDTINIKENRRNPQKLIDISSDFIVKKNAQERKELEYYKDVENPNMQPIKIVKYNINITRNEIGNIIKIENDWRSKTLKLGAIIDYILEHSRNPEILILGRNNDDIDEYVGNDLFKVKGRNKIKKVIYSKREDLDITFMTIHQAKGLEADEVIVLNLEDRYSGFPNQIEDDPILSFVKDVEECEFAEERRLLYVALTRSRNNVYLLAPKGIPSQFISDLAGYDGVTNLDLTYNVRRKNLHLNQEFLKDLIIHPTDLDCPNCDDGKIAIIENNVNKTTYVRCSKYPRSKDHYDGGPYPKWGLDDIKYVEKCPKCRGILVRNGDLLKCCLNYNEGCMETKELNLDKKDLEFDYD